LTFKSKLNEDATRKILIDKALQKRGWNLKDETQVAEEYELKVPPSIAGGEVESDRFVDYLLFDNVGDPLAVVEAKKYSRDAYEGKRQAEEYADALKQKTGKDCFIFLTNGEDILFWDRPHYATRKVMGFFTQDELMTRRQQHQSSSDPRTMKIKELIVDRPYQIQAIKKVTEEMAKGKRKFLLTLATGTGKN